VTHRNDSNIILKISIDRSDSVFFSIFAYCWSKRRKK